jgi:small subunit ribosomal protein S9
LATATRIQHYGTGKRKTSVARVYLRPGSGQIQVNRRPLEDYFPSDTLKMVVKQPLQLTETSDKFDISANIQGGGLTGQAWAMRLGISRALCEFNQELRGRLKKAGFLTRDSRIKERKKYGQPGARKRFQYSKR